MLGLRHLISSIRRVGSNAASHAVTDEKDLLGGALQDADLLIAFAAQSRRTIRPEKVKSLITASQNIRDARNESRPLSPDEASRFWIAYDELAVDMAPLSALSIRASRSINEKRFPASLSTPTAYNSLAAVAVFLVCLALQGFWVAGNELISRADLLEGQKSELQKRIEANSGLIRRAEQREGMASQRLCAIEDCEASPPPLTRTTAKREGAALLQAELAVLNSDLREKSIIGEELSQELTLLNTRSRPLEQLLTQWHERAKLVCDNFYLRFLCPVDSPKVSSPDEQQLEQEIKETRAKLKAARDDYDQARTDLRASSLRSFEKRLQLSTELRRLEEKKAGRDLDAFRSILVEVRITVANLGAYLIAMAMGILGALTFVLRNLSRQLSEYTYIPVPISVTIVRVCLGAIAGVFGSLLVPPEQSALKSLPPLFIPFVFGYGIEILFSLLDKIVMSFTTSDGPSVRQISKQ